MSAYRYILEPYKGIATRHTCPACEQKKCFSHYIDTENKVSFPNHVGRCDREEKCGYHFTPKQYFEENPDKRESFSNNQPTMQRNFSSVKEKEVSYIDGNLVASSLGYYHQNKLFQYLSSQLGEDEAMKLMAKYKVGSAKHWDGATVFWQMDITGRVRTGKIMLYAPETGKRVKHPYNHITWVHSLLKQENFNLKQCFFGEHLLFGHSDQPVAIVESEKTALISSFYMPQFQWIATGGKHGCFSEFLEKRSTPEQRKEGYDIADFLLEAKQPTAILQAMIKRNPALKTLMKEFDLVVDNSFRNKVNPRKKTGFKL